jgi:hypothetical protein
MLSIASVRRGRSLRPRVCPCCRQRPSCGKQPYPTLCVECSTAQIRVRERSLRSKPDVTLRRELARARRDVRALLTELARRRADARRLRGAAK